MNSLRLLVATALCAWLSLPSQSLAQCSGTISISDVLNASQSSSATGNFAVGAQNVSVNMTSWSGGGGAWAADLMVYLTAPDGSCVVWGGYSAGLPTNGCTDLGTGAGAAPWPDDWETGNGSTFSAVIDVSQGNLSGSGEWTITILNGYDFSTNVNYNIEFTIEGECLGECPDPDACNYVPEDEITNALLEVCEYPEDLFGPGYDCDGQCINDEDGDDICDEVDPCVGEYDACGVCNGPGEIYECGCYDADALGVCDGNCAVDADADGICDECIPPPGYWIDIEEVMVHTDGELDGMVTYRVSLGCESEADFLEAISGGGHRCSGDCLVFWDVVQPSCQPFLEPFWIGCRFHCALSQFGLRQLSDHRRR
ncbi:hypothetical protein N9V29_00115 [Flavobacteriales bacterium]|nr:hypothetical protein [Flavobacteriales bacterium]